MPLFFKEFLDWLRTTWFWPGAAEVGEFFATHLISGMIPAFFIAGAIAVFLDKQRVTRLMGSGANPFLAYPVAAVSGAILTVCSCGVIPIFTSILQQGAGIGPAFTFLFSSPAVNLIAIMYTYSWLGIPTTIARIVAVIFSAVVIGILMKAIFGEINAETAEITVLVAENDEDERSDTIQLCFFGLLILITLTSTGLFNSFLRLDLKALSNFQFSPAMNSFLQSNFLKLILLFFEIAFLSFILYFWFPKDEIIQWLKKSWSLFEMIFPKVVIGIFITGVIGANLPLTAYMSSFDENTLFGNLLMSIIGSLMYFGSIVGVNIVATMNKYGMNIGLVLALLLSGPAVSLPSILALIPITGLKKGVVYLTLAVLCSTFCGYFFGLVMTAN